MRNPVAVVVALFMLVLAGRSTSKQGSERPESTPSTSAQSTPSGPPTADQARAIAKEAYIYGFPMVDSYRIQNAYFINPSSPEYKGPWNEVHSAARVYTPADTAVQTPNPTPVLDAGADLRHEPLVLLVPPIDKDRYYYAAVRRRLHLQLRLWAAAPPATAAVPTCSPGRTGTARSPRASPRSSRPTPTSPLVIYRTQLFGPDDLDNVKKVQAGYQAMPLSTFLKKTPPAEAPAMEWPTPLTPMTRRPR